MGSHPITRAGLLLVLIRLVGVQSRYLNHGGDSNASRLALFLPAVAAHTGVLLVIIALFVLAARAVAGTPRLRRPITIAACSVFTVLVIGGQADLTVSSITGAPLTPTVFRTFRGIHVVTSNEFLEPLRANLTTVIVGMTALVAMLVGMAVLVARDRQRGVDHEVSWGRGLALAGGGALLAALPALAPWPGPPPPVEVAFAAEYLGLDRAAPHGSDADTIRDLRELVGLPAGARWLSDEYPLVYGWPDRADTPARPLDAQPDIVVVMIESLRAEELGLVTGAHDSVTPSLDALARRSVVFPTFTSNGFPSAPSVLAFHCSAWPHRRKEIITDFADRGFDSIPARLRTLGYDAVYIGADPNFDNQDRWLGRWYSPVVDLVAQGVAATDHNIVVRGIEEIRRHDRDATVKPLFTFVSTYSTHYPFRLPADGGEDALPASSSLQARYRQVLRYTDREVGALLSYLDTRARRDRTVTIVLGDHGFYTDLKSTSGLPENDNEWTAAMVAGPVDLVGAPRRITSSASHVDMLPTVLALVGDRRPSAALGGDLLGPPRTATRSAFAIRPGGLRFDRDGYAVMVDARTPNQASHRVAFPGVMAAGAVPAADLTATRISEWATEWSYLIEQNRVWNADRFLPAARQ